MNPETYSASDGIFYTCYEDLRKEAAWTVHIREVVDEWTRRGENVILFIPRIYPFASPPRCRIVPVPTVDIRFVREYLFLFLLPFYVLFYGVRKCPRVVYSRETAFMPGIAIACFLLGIPLVMEINGCAPLDLERIGAGRARIRFYTLMQRISIRVASAYVFVSHHLLSVFRERYSLDSDKIHVVPNGVDTNRFSPGDAGDFPGLDDRAEYITYIGSFHPHALTPLIVEAAARVIKTRPTAMLLMVGDGHDRAACEAAADRLSITERVVFTGIIPHHQIPRAIRASSVLINIIMGADDTQSMKMLEYLAAGAPVIANGATLHDVPLEANTHYVKVESLTSDALADAVLSVLDDESLAQRLGIRGRQLILENFSWEKTAGRLIEAIDTTIRRK
jgi:glycosyltransferase involved in cell wall biosynthesis